MSPSLSELSISVSPNKIATPEMVKALFRKEVTAYASGIGFSEQICPMLNAKLNCDCHATKLLAFGNHECLPDAPCIVRVLFFPKGTFS